MSYTDIKNNSPVIAIFMIAIAILVYRLDHNLNKPEEFTQAISVPNKTVEEINASDAIVSVGSIEPKQNMKVVDLKFNKFKVYNEITNKYVNLNKDYEALRVNLFLEAANQISKCGYSTAKDEMIWIAYATKKRAHMFNNLSIAEAVTHAKTNNYGLPVSNGAHFSWFADDNPTGVKFIPNDEPSKKAWELSSHIAKGVINGTIKDPTKGHDHYCTLEVEKKTKWVKDMKKQSRTVKCDHVFFASPYKLTRDYN